RRARIQKPFALKRAPVRQMLFNFTGDPTGRREVRVAANHRCPRDCFPQLARFETNFLRPDAVHLARLKVIRCASLKDSLQFVIHVFSSLGFAPHFSALLLRTFAPHFSGEYGTYLGRLWLWTKRRASDFCGLFSEAK